MNRMGRRAYFIGAVIGTALNLLPVIAGATLADNRPAPELAGVTWLNTAKKGTNAAGATGVPITLAGRKGKVTVVHFWTYGCINCKRNLPIYSRWQKRFEQQDVQIIGIHTPETPGEKVTANVEKQVKAQHITYPVLVDPNGENWNRWQQQYWPTVYLIDKQGRVRYHWEGELEYNGAGGEASFAQHIEELLKEK